MDINQLIIYIVFSLIAMIFLLNIFKVFLNIFKAPNPQKNEDPMVAEVRSQIEQEVKPHLTSLEGMYEKRESEQKSLASFVFSVVKNKFSAYMDKNEKLVEEEISKCCSEYENAECKESYCLEGSGISCAKT